MKWRIYALISYLKLCFYNFRDLFYREVEIVDFRRSVYGELREVEEITIVLKDDRDRYQIVKFTSKNGETLNTH